MIDISTLKNKVEDNGATSAGRLQAGEWNTLVSAIEELQDESYVKPATGIPSADIADGVIPDTSGLATKSEVSTGLSTKQDTLVSGTNIKTVSGESLLGSGDITITAGDSNAVKYTSQSLSSEQQTQARTNIGAGTSSFSGSYNDLSNKPTIPDVPTISTNISTDSASDTKTASPKAVKTYVDAGIASVESDISDLEDVVEAIDIGAYVIAWDGDSEPVLANIPTGVSVTYNTTTYTGTLAASASTIQKIYLVATGTTDNYDRYITIGDSTYSWVNLGTTEITLSDYATKSEVSQLEQGLTDIMPHSVKSAIYTILNNVAFANDTGYSSELGIIRTWVENLVLMSISADFDQQGNIYVTDSLNKLKQYLTVTAAYDDSSSIVLYDSDYQLSGTLEVGTSTITVSYQGKTDTFNVTVQASPYLYVLPSAFSSAGSNSINTGFKPSKSTTYTILCEAVESTASQSAVFIFGNRPNSSSNNYVGLTTQGGRFWGFGHAYADRVSIGNNVLRFTLVGTVSSSGNLTNITIKYKVGSGGVQTETVASHGPDITSTSFPNFILGAPYSNGGFIGTINSFAVYEGEMSALDIADFLNNGMSE